MGYKRPRKTYKELNFTGDLAGLHAVFRELSIDQMLRLVRLASSARGLTGDDPLDVKLERAQTLGADLFTEVAKGLISWDLEDDDDTPVPVTYEGIAAQGIEFITEIVVAWIEAMSSVDTPLQQSSNGGQPSAELESSLQLASLSASPPS
jgi:hypothetical protein